MENTEESFNYYKSVNEDINENLENISYELDSTLAALEENARSNGYNAKKNMRAAPVKLWSVGMTASKTQVVVDKLMVAMKDVLRFRDDPVYGPVESKLFDDLIKDIGDAFIKYDDVMRKKCASDPKFKKMYGELSDSGKAFAYEVGNGDGWTIEDNDGSLRAAQAQWNTMGMWAIG